MNAFTSSPSSTRLSPESAWMIWGLGTSVVGTVAVISLISLPYSTAALVITVLCALAQLVLSAWLMLGTLSRPFLERSVWRYIGFVLVPVFMTGNLVGIAVYSLTT